MRIQKLPSAQRPPWQPLPREVVEYHRRQKFVTAAANLVHEDGIAALTAERLCRAAHAAKKTYYDLFGDTSEFLRCAFAEAFARTFGPVQRVLEEEEEWPAKVKRAIEELLQTVAEEPALAELCLVHSFSKPEEAAGHDLGAATELLRGLLEGGRKAGREALGEAYPDPPPLIEELTAAAILSMVSTHLLSGETDRLRERSADLEALATRPFFAGP